MRVITKNNSHAKEYKIYFCLLVLLFVFWVSFPLLRKTVNRCSRRARSGITAASMPPWS